MSLVLGLALVALGVLPTGARAQDLIVDGETRVLGGVQRFSRIEVINGGRIEVLPFDGTDREGTGNLVLVADAILVDATSTISARGSGYQVLRCGDGDGPVPGAGGAGGCSVRDSGGGGAHFGAGGRGTKDCFVFGSRTTCQFPEEFEEDCGNTLNAAGSACSSRANCNDLDGLPTVAGAGYFHSIWEVEFGAAGGDKGCRDGDGFGSQPVVGGPGGGRIVLAGVNATETGSVTIAGTLDADGKRGCGTGNDSGGGGAGGTILVVADVLTVADTAVLSAAGGLGGDTNARAGVRSEDCPTNAQAPGGTCDDCGGGGGGGLISLLSRGQAIAAGADFDVGGAAGGECPICEGEAGGGAGELQLNRLYQGETCDGFDNDFDGFVDEGLGTFTCGLGSCATSLDACTAGVATSCVPDTVGAGCTAPPVCDEPRVLVILDTSASMLQDLDGGPTFGDGSLEHPGLDTDGDGDANDARLFLAKEAVSQLISNYPEIDFALARYAQDTSADQSCQLAAWIECAGIFATYDDPGDNTGPVECIVDVGAGTRTIRRVSTGEECINYAGSCGDPRRGADILAGFGSDTRDVVRWLDGRETDFRTGTATGDYCAHADGGDCELRATGPTPLEGALDAAFDYITPIQTTDPCTACRGYSVILVTDGAESCDGDPATAAEALFDAGIEVEVVAVSVLASEEASLNAIARAGSGDARDATFVRTPGDLVPTLTRLVAGAIRVEQCNGADDDCDLAIDEGFPGLGDACADDGIGICQGTGAIECRADGSGTECSISSPGGVSVVVVCNDLDDDCDGGIDEGLTCTGECTPTGPEVCNGLDDNCNGAIDETDPAVGTACGDDEGACRSGALRCVAGELVCVGAVGPRDEVCNGLDDDCDGALDDFAECPGATLCAEGFCRRECGEGEFPCPAGFQCEDVEGARLCLPSPCAACTREQRCVDDVCVDACEGVSCDAPAVCERGRCVTCYQRACTGGEICIRGECGADPCAGVECGADDCRDGECVTACQDDRCPLGEVCDATGACVPDDCAALDCGEQVCVEGACRDAACTAGSCPAGTVCVGALGCVPDPCETVTCGEGRTCVADARGNAQCEGALVGGEGDARVLAAGGDTLFGCGAGAGAAGLWPLLALLALRRRRGIR